jgi:demethylmenaquinone methyltransferase/2-methoxy-6-polyprenyl-1,4-benzoquinol methylase
MDVQRVLAEQVAYYQARAAEYDDWWERRFEYDLGERFRQLWRADTAELRRSLLEFGPRGDVLELAAGTGIWTKELLRHADHVTAVDAASEALALNESRNGVDRATYLVADLFSWTPPRRFDAICFAFWISHVPAVRWEAFWALVGAALAPGGRVWFCDSAHPKHAEAHGPDVVRGRGDPADEDVERRVRKLRDGRTFHVVKRNWFPADLQTELAAIGWRATVANTPWAFIHGSATRVRDGDLNG